MIVRLLALLLIYVIIAFTLVGCLLLHWPIGPEAAWPAFPVFALIALSTCIVLYPDDRI